MALQPTTMTSAKTMAQLTEEFLALKTENERLKANAAAKTSGQGIKVSTKGAVSVYGLGRWPVTLYAGQWAELLAKGDDITKFIAANGPVLSIKP